MNPLPHDYQSGVLVHSATQLLAFQEWKLGFIKMFNDKPLLISVPRSLLSCCTVLLFIWAYFYWVPHFIGHNKIFLGSVRCFRRFLSYRVVRQWCTDVDPPETRRSILTKMIVSNHTDKPNFNLFSKQEF